MASGDGRGMGKTIGKMLKRHVPPLARKRRRSGISKGGQDTLGIFHTAGGKSGAREPQGTAEHLR